ncbi:type II toxin-antitoxin system VapC family toxin [Rufibacter sp. LB8]|uniref:type II toxin-antitoxin system VapC family toxin n=1 Tax=Rufibacter sp. LB8 TaxID=2777781 RepID=UPI0021031FDA|nr:type II toxin-antitoxin system VapC family toxin [Rufibacter sp. LB8]
MLDTNICIYYLKGRFDLDAKIEQVGSEHCFISEITVAELKYGAENSEKKEQNRKVIQDFIQKFTVVPIFSALDIFAKEKARLRKKGILVDDFDLLIGATALANELTVVTNNIKHIGRLKNISLENWAE